MNKLKRHAGLFLLIASFNASAQDCSCLNDLDYVAEQLPSTPSFKSQIKDRQVLAEAKAALAEEISADANIAQNCLFYLQRLLKVVRDEHLYLMDRREGVDYAAYTQVYEGSPDALAALATSTTDDPITGIYQLLTAYRVAVIKVDHQDYDYAGYILESGNEDWVPGQLKFTLQQSGDHFIGNFYSGSHAPSFEQVRQEQGRLVPTRWIKDDFAAQYAVDNYTLDGAAFQYREYAPGVHYVRLGSFSGSNANYSAAMELLETLKNQVQSGAVIIDLRNNGGGGERVSDPFLKLFKKRRKKLDFYILQNHNVGSNSEHFLLLAKKRLQARTYGENTRGALAYGYGNYPKPALSTACHGYSLGLTTSKSERYLDFEVVGIPPDEYLDHRTDWIEQLLARIEPK